LPNKSTSELIEDINTELNFDMVSMKKNLKYHSHAAMHRFSSPMRSAAIKIIVETEIVREDDNDVWPINTLQKKKGA